MSSLRRWTISVQVAFRRPRRCRLCPPAQGFAAKEPLPGSLVAGSEAKDSADTSVAVAGAHLPGSRRVASATAESADSKAQAESVSVKDAPAKKAPAKGKQPSLAKSGSLCFSVCDVRCGYRVRDHDGGVER